jgi:hypothetical protein
MVGVRRIAGAVRFITSIKATTERLTLAWIQRSKLKRARRGLLTHKP